MTASGFHDTPKMTPRSGTPPIMPCSTVRVISLEPALLERPRCHPVGHADAEVDHRPAGDLVERAPGDDFAFGQRHGGRVPKGT